MVWDRYTNIASVSNVFRLYFSYCADSGIFCIPFYFFISLNTHSLLRCSEYNTPSQYKMANVLCSPLDMSELCV